MKIEVSIPDELVALADRVVQRGPEQTSRSALLTQALKEYLDEYRAIDFDELEKYGSCTTRMSPSSTNDRIRSWSR